MESVRDYELRGLFAYVIGVLERLEIPYMVVGGFAAIMYGEPRLTIDVDIVVDMELKHAMPFASAFPIPEYYARAEGIRDSLRRRYPFNVIQPATGAKIDLVPLADDAFTQAAFRRRRRLEYDEAGNTATFITPEDIVVAKLAAFQQTGSDKHLRDTRGVLMMQWGQLDLDTLRRSARACGVTDPLEELLGEVGRRIQE